MAKQKSSKATESGLKEWDRTTTMGFPAELAAQVNQLTGDYLHQAVAMGAAFSPDTRSEFLRKCTNQLESAFEATIKESLRSSLTELHRAAVETLFQRWLGGETSFTFPTSDDLSLPKVDARNAEKLAALFARTTIKHYEWSFERVDMTGDRDCYEIRSHCDFSVGDWEATATWELSGDHRNQESEGSARIADETTAPHKNTPLSAIEDRVQSGLPPHFLAAYLNIISFDLVNIPYKARPNSEDLPSFVPEGVGPRGRRSRPGRAR